MHRNSFFLSFVSYFFFLENEKKTAAAPTALLLFAYRVEEITGN